VEVRAAEHRSRGGEIGHEQHGIAVSESVFEADHETVF